jgi:glycosyltransferase involved in cell wall biosynthesis
VLNPRGLRQYVRQDTFFAAIPKVLAVRPEVQFVAVDLRGWQWGEQWIERSRLKASVFLTGHLTQAEMAELYKQALITVSPTEHDGTPNSLLEALACGCFPICGNLPSIREWINDGINGILVDPSNPAALAQAILRALSDDQWRDRAASHNRQLVTENANYDQCMQRADLFYQEVIENCRR